jgi:hypothetical protein
MWHPDGGTIRSMKWSIVAVVTVAGCATAGKDDHQVGNRPDSGIHGTDGNNQPLPDSAPLADAPPGQTAVTLSQTGDMTLAAGAGIACGNALGTGANNWYRIFPLSEYGITTTFHVQSVSFMVDYASGVGGAQPGQVKLGTYTAALDTTTLAGTITPLTAATISIPDGDSNTAIPPPVVAPISTDVPAGSNLVVELDVPDGTAVGDYFYIGVSTAAETHASYIKYPQCGASVPTTLASLGHTNNKILLTVTGTH